MCEAVVDIETPYSKEEFIMKQYNVTGMSCAACSARVEKAVNKVPGVTSCSVSLLTNSMGVEGTASASAIVSAVEEAGYGCSLKGASGQKESVSDAEKALDEFLSSWLISLGVDPETATSDACRIEHVISPESFTAIKEHLSPGK